MLDTNYYKKENIQENKDEKNEKLSLKGKINFIFLIGVIFAVLLSGTDSLKFPVFNLFDVSVLKGNLLRDLILVGMAMLSLIFTHNSYRKFRLSRAMMRDREEELDSLILADFLNKYAATGEEYTKIIKKIIEQNSLQDFDKVKLLPSSIKFKNLI